MTPASILQQAPDTIFSPTLYAIFFGLAVGYATSFISRLFGLACLVVLIFEWIGPSQVFPDWIAGVSAPLSIGVLAGIVLSILIEM
jgi:hypothetical protein